MLQEIILGFENMFKLGDDVVGKFEFPQEEVKCLQVETDRKWESKSPVYVDIGPSRSCGDELEGREGGGECAGTEHRTHDHGIRARDPLQAAAADERSAFVHHRIGLADQYLIIDQSVISRTFPDVPVKVRWRLRFEFVTTTQKVLDQQGPTEVGAVSRLATDLDIQTMKWDLPISVLTSNPFNAGLICLQPSTTSFSI